MLTVLWVVLGFFVCVTVLAWICILLIWILLDQADYEMDQLQILEADNDDTAIGDEDLMVVCTHPVRSRYRNLPNRSPLPVF